ncbi:hypothetical protein QUF76_18415 [Desulfobacterales bacterium HSG16]|nr:hypothetical protein [Desulfobacterales bacterium HSG16]
MSSFKNLIVEYKQSKASVLSLIQSEKIMNIATCNNTGSWTAPVCFVYYASDFCFFSSTNSRHIIDSFSQKNVAASIHTNTCTWQDIKGVQMTGSIKSVSSFGKSTRTITAYLDKFPFCREFFSTDKNIITPDDFFNIFKAKLYKFIPEDIYYLDNQIGFGKREKIEFLP